VLDRTADVHDHAAGAEVPAGGKLRLARHMRRAAARAAVARKSLRRDASMVAAFALECLRRSAALTPVARKSLRRHASMVAAFALECLRRSAAALMRAGTGGGDFFVGAWRILRTEGIAGALRGTWQFFVSQIFSSLTRRIVILNVAGLLAFMIGILYLTQFRAGLIDARVQSLIVQGELIAKAVASQATADTDAINIDPERLLELQAGESYGPSDDTLFGFEFPVNPERVAPLLRQLITPTNTRARIYDRDGTLILDSRSLFGRGDVLRFDLPPPTQEKPGLVERSFIAIRTWLGRGDLPRYRELGPENGKGYPEVGQALDGQKASVVRINDRGEVIVLVAVPIQRFRTVRGALLVSTQGGDIDQTVEAERLAILKVFLIAAGIMMVLSVLLAGTIAGRVRRRLRGRVEIPDFTRRRDEIGHLSGNLREMTYALYNRIEAIESFAADVAHELKNPLTSLRSAVETLPLAKTEHSRGRLLAVIQDDVKRLDRLISDISDASRLDAELQRQEAAPVDLMSLLPAVVTVANEVKRADGVMATLAFEGSPRRFMVQGRDSRLSQVVNNLIDNARSFSPPNGKIRISCRRSGAAVVIAVDDDGPGIRPDAMEKIFERFYTDRPQQNFGQNSGLGLSISKQIVEAHGGRLSVQNRLAGAGQCGGGEAAVLGARFIVELPAM
jgi:two-component system sensor histidine kinase ChvG